MFCWLGLYTHTALYLLITTQTQGKRSEKHLSHFISFTKQGQQTITGQSLPLFPMLILCFPFSYDVFILFSPIFQTTLLVKKYLHTRITMYLCHTSHDRSYHTGEPKQTKQKQTKTRKEGKGLELCVICRQMKGKVGFTHSPCKLSYFVTVLRYNKCACSSFLHVACIVPL